MLRVSKAALMSLPDWKVQYTSPEANAGTGQRQATCRWPRRVPYLAPHLQGFRLHGGEYRSLPSVAMVGGGLSLRSEALGLDVRLDEGDRLRLHDPATGEDLPAHEEMQTRVEEEIAARRATEVRLEKEAAAHGVWGCPMAVNNDLARPDGRPEVIGIYCQ